MPHHPYDMDPTPTELKKGIEKARATYVGLPETVCDHRALCCQAGCPNLYYSEYLSLREGFIEKMTTDQRLELTAECVKRYLMNQRVEKLKPCVFLGEKNMCTVYDCRPLKCRTYGLIPDALYKWVVKSVAHEMQVPEFTVPLCWQCDRVKVKPEFAEKFPNGCVPEDMLRDLEKRLRDVDLKLGLPKDVQDAGHGFLTFHDWHVMFELGESWMVKLTKLRIKLSDEEKEQFVSSLKDALRGNTASEQEKRA